MSFNQIIAVQLQVRRKFLLAMMFDMVFLKSKKKSGNFIKLYPDFDFRTSALIRIFLPYAVTATAGAMGRNTCPIRANLRYLVCQQSSKKDRTDPFPVSCRVSRLVICIICNDCKDLHKVVPVETPKKEVQFSK